MATITRIRPKRHDVILEGLRFALDFGNDWGLRQETKDDLAQAVGRLAPQDNWGYVMMNPDQQRLVLRAIDDGLKPHTTLKVWQAVISFIAYDRDGEIMAARAQLADAANVALPDVSMAMKRLIDIGAVIRIRPGRFKVNSHVAWSGPLHKRDIAAKDCQPISLSAGPMLVVMEGGKP